MDLDYVQAECLRWITQNRFSRVVLQFHRDELKQSKQIVDHLSRRYSGPLEIFVTQSKSCSLDLLITQHISDIDAIIHVGKVCVTKPEIKCAEIQKSVLFVFGRPNLQPDQFSKNVANIFDQVKSLAHDKIDKPFCILYDTDLMCYATGLDDMLQKSPLKERIEVASIFCPVQSWYTTSENDHKFIKGRVEDSHRLGCFCLKKPIDQYGYALYLGSKPSIQLALKGPSTLWTISESEANAFVVEEVNVSRLLNKRIALVNRLQDEEELKIGVIITNPLPDIDCCMAELECYARVRKHVLYFISMIQTTDEYKIGNFDLCDAFVIINSCSCSTILESLVFNRPILNDLEFKLACGFEATYGRVLWPASSTHLSADDLINKRKVSDVSLALVHTRNELLERCARSRINLWSGMDFKATSEVDGNTVESLDIEEGLIGIASAYNSEPVKKA